MLLSRIILAILLRKHMFHGLVGFLLTVMVPVDRDQKTRFCLSMFKCKLRVHFFSSCSFPLALPVRGHCYNCNICHVTGFTTSTCGHRWTPHGTPALSICSANPRSPTVKSNHKIFQGGSWVAQGYILNGAQKRFHCLTANSR